MKTTPCRTCVLLFPLALTALNMEELHLQAIHRANQLTERVASIPHLTTWFVSGSLNLYRKSVCLLQNDLPCSLSACWRMRSSRPCPISFRWPWAVIESTFPYVPLLFSRWSLRLEISEKVNSTRKILFLNVDHYFVIIWGPSLDRLDVLNVLFKRCRWEGTCYSRYG